MPSLLKVIQLRLLGLFGVVYEVPTAALTIFRVKA